MRRVQEGEANDNSNDTTTVDANESPVFRQTPERKKRARKTEPY